MIPLDRPVIGDDVNQLRTKLGISAVEMTYLVGMTMPKYSKMVSADKHEPVASPAIDLIIRVLDEDPSLSLLPKFVTPTALYDRLGHIRKIDLKRLSIMTGREASNGYRLISRKSRPAPMLSRVMSLLAARLNQAQQTPRRNELTEDLISAVGQLAKSVAKSKQTSPEIKKVLDIYEELFAIREAVPSKEIAELERWDQLVETVAASRGIDNIFRLGRWTPTGGAEDAAAEEDE